MIPNVGATLLGVVGELVTGTAGANPSMVNGLVDKSPDSINGKKRRKNE